MMSLTFGLFTQVSDLGPHGPLVCGWWRNMLVKKACLQCQRWTTRNSSFFKTILAISVWRESDNERLSAMEPC